MSGCYASRRARRKARHAVATACTPECLIGTQKCRISEDEKLDHAKQPFRLQPDSLRLCSPLRPRKASDRRGVVRLVIVTDCGTHS